MKAMRTVLFRALCVLLAAVMILTLVVSGMAAYQWAEQIESFERYDPVYDNAVETGTAREDLDLPETLRAIVGIPEGMDVTTFVQAEPVADTSDGSENYDYYWYGYVAPKNASELVAEGEKAIYTIYYADGRLAYRLYGSIEGSENLWFACDEGGNITGAVLDIPVEWSGDYNGDVAGTYTFSASVSAASSYRWSGEAPTAVIVVDGEEEAEEETHCTCGAQADEDGWVTHGEGCPLYEASELHCTCALGKDLVSAEHDESCPLYQGETLLCTCALASDERSDRHDVTCPCFLRMAVDCHCGADGQAIDEDNFPWAHLEDCKYYSPLECMCREEIEVEVEDYDGHTGEFLGTHTEMIPGDFSHVHDPENRDCPLYGKDTVRIIKLNSGEESVMAVEDAERIIAVQNAAVAYAQNGADDTETDMEADAGDTDNAQDAAEANAADSVKNFAQNQENAGILYPVLGPIEIVEGSLQSAGYDAELMLYAAGANETKMDAAVTANLPTSGNASWAGASKGAWLDYVRTRFRNKYNSWTWATVPSGTPKWGGGTATISKTDSVWEVADGSQLRYAMLNYSSGDTISLQNDIDMNGAVYNWTSVAIDVTNKGTITIEGNGHTLYNLGIYSTTAYRGFVHTTIPGACKANVTIQNLTFSGAKIVYNHSDYYNASNKMVGYGGLFLFRDGYGGANTAAKSAITRVYVKDSLFAQTSTKEDAQGALSAFGYLNGMKSTYTAQKITQCGVQNTIVGGLGHPAAMFVFANGMDMSYCFAVDNAIFAMNQAHGGLMNSCSGIYSRFQYCFASGELYGTEGSGGFMGPMTQGGVLQQCYATGKVEAQSGSAGFQTGGSSGGYNTSISHCYTSVLVGLRSDVSGMAGFIRQAGNATVSNSYAVGEVGDFTTNLANPTQTGGFTTSHSDSDTVTFTNCYYDKQTTAMREWAAGNSKEVPGVTGLLTTTSSKNGGSGWGMTSGKYLSGLGTSTWVYTAGHYPQLKVFADATAATWGSDEVAELVKAYSLVSTSTVYLDTWEEGYTWSSTGVRSQTMETYDSTVYDTVREIISPFTVTNDGTTWSELISGGAPAEINAVRSTETIKIQGGSGTVNGPGMNWFEVTRDGASRPLRLIGYMNINAGSDKTIYTGDHYDHRQDVELTMMNSITDNLVVGVDNDKIWSTAKQAGYPTVSNTDASKATGFYGVATDHTNHLKTNFSASVGAKLNTEIWRVAQDSSGDPVKNADGTYQTTHSVKVTGAGTSGDGTSPQTEDEKKWNGQAPFFSSEANGQTYLVSYYWQLQDGRYVTDSKLITLRPGTQTLTVNACDGTGTPGSGLLTLAVAQGDTVPTSLTGGQTVKKEGIPFGTNAVAAWKKVNPETCITKIVVTLTDGYGDVQGTATMNGRDVNENTQFTFPNVKYYYLTTVEDEIQGQREVSAVGRATLEYTIEKTDDDIFYLAFNNFYEKGNANNKGVIPASGSEDITVDEMNYNISVQIYVERKAYITVKNNVTGTVPSELTGHTFFINLQDGGMTTQVSLSDNEASKVLCVDIPGSSKTLNISEIVPMGFTLQDITLANDTGSRGTQPTLTEDGTLTIYPSNRVIVTVTNEYAAQAYFKSSTWVDNTFAPAS